MEIEKGILNNMFTKQQAISITYDNNKSTKAHSLDHFCGLAEVEAKKGFTSVYVHSPDDPNYFDLTINIEANDDDFYDVTSTPRKREQFRNSVYKTLAQLFPNLTIQIIWYSGFEHHKYETLLTTNGKPQITF